MQTMQALILRAHRDVAGVKMARGLPAASGPVPWNGFEFDKQASQPLRTPVHTRPASTQPERDVHTAEIQGEGKAESGRKSVDQLIKRPKDLKTYTMRPKSYGKDRADLLWKDPKYSNTQPRIDCSKRTDEELDLDTKSVRELLGRPATSDPLLEVLIPVGRVDSLRDAEGGSRLSTSATRMGTANTWNRSAQDSECHPVESCVQESIT